VRHQCQDPATRGLVKIHRAHWTGWAWPTATDPDGVRIMTAGYLSAALSGRNH
jgi:hypothetical protein